jgi:MtaA/CmuA family methyltransferase
MSPRDVLLRHLAGESVDRLPAMPITMQFAARVGGASYADYCRDQRVLARCQALVAERFGIDHVSVISDPAREASDLGATVTWFTDQPPAIDESRALLAEPADLARLRVIDPLVGPRMLDRVRGVELLRAGPGQTRLVEGWVEGPCAEGADLRGINAIMLDFYEDPGFVEDLFDFVIRQAIAFAQAQVDAGADIIGIGDAAASLVGPRIYRESVLPHERRLVDAVHDMGALVRLHICGNISRSLEDVGLLGADIVDLDYPVAVDAARAAVGPDQVLLGNLDPVREILDASAEDVWRGVARCHRMAGRRYIVGAGCEIPVATAHERLAAMTAYARATHPEAIPAEGGPDRA